MTTKHLEGQWRGRAQSLVLDDILKTGWAGQLGGYGRRQKHRMVQVGPVSGCLSPGRGASPQVLSVGLELSEGHMGTHL